MKNKFWELQQIYTSASAMVGGRLSSSYHMYYTKDYIDGHSSQILARRGVWVCEAADDGGDRTSVYRTKTSTINVDRYPLCT